MNCCTKQISALVQNHPNLAQRKCSSGQVMLSFVVRGRSEVRSYVPRGPGTSSSGSQGGVHGCVRRLEQDACGGITGRCRVCLSCVIHHHTTSLLRTFSQRHACIWHCILSISLLRAASANVQDSRFSDSTHKYKPSHWTMLQSLWWELELCAVCHKAKDFWPQGHLKEVSQSPSMTVPIASQGPASFSKQRVSKTSITLTHMASGLQHKYRSHCFCWVPFQIHGSFGCATLQ